MTPATCVHICSNFSKAQEFRATLVFAISFGIVFTLLGISYIIEKINERKWR